MRTLSLLAGSVVTMCMAAAAALARTAQPPQRHTPLEKTIGAPHSNRPVPSLAVINAANAKLESGKLILSGVSANTIVFADRPVRAAGHETTRQFIMQWDEGKDSFAKNPPNATVSALSANPGEVSDAVVVLKSPKLDGSTLTFDVTMLEGASISGGPVAVFVDAFAFRGPMGAGVAHVGGFGGATVWHAPVYHGAWYAHPYADVGAGLAAGAVVGAAAATAASPYRYPPPACGYYPYPPCY